MDKTHTHPAFGHLSISRQSSSHNRLFGASGPCYNCVTIQISEASLNTDQDSGRCTIWPTNHILEVTLSPLQFAEAVATLNCSEGTACTITRRDGKIIPAPDQSTTRRQMVEDSFRKNMVDLGRECDEFLERARALKEKPNVNKGDREEFVKLAEGLVAKITATTPYVVSQFTEVVERMLTEIKVDLPAPSSGS
jgi:hypothetical protein